MKKKIETLFEYRKIPYLLSFIEKKSRKKLNKNLIKLQIAIYELDHYLETNWDLSQKELTKCWKEIFKSLKKLELKPTKAFELTNHIRRYQRHEEQLRIGKLPTRINKEFYYYFKSCDVRLMREIIYDLNPAINLKCKLQDWRYFDIITEINDDVEDVFEDQKTINGNMFLIQFIEQGPNQTIKEFEAFIQTTLSKERLRHSGSKSKDSNQINKAAIKEANRTLEMVYRNVEILKNTSIKRQMPLLKHKILSFIP